MAITNELSTPDEISAWFDNDTDALSDLQGAKLLWSEYNGYDYEGDASVVFVKPDGSLWVEVDGHCSCNGMEWGPWRAESLDALLANQDFDADQVALMRERMNA